MSDKIKIAAVVGPIASSREIMLNAYKEAIEKEYRFFSFGDAMLIV